MLQGDWLVLPTTNRKRKVNVSGFIQYSDGLHSYSQGVGREIRTLSDRSRAPMVSKACFDADMAKARAVVPTASTRYQHSTNYIDGFNSWFGALNYDVYTKKETKRTLIGEDGVWVAHRELQYRVCANGAEKSLVLRSAAEHRVLKTAINICCFKLMRQAVIQSESSVVRAQMDDGTPVSQESIQGQVDQTSDKQENTIITADTTVTESSPEAHPEHISFASSEKPMQFKRIVGRWMPLGSFTVASSNPRGTILKQWDLPKDCYMSTTSKVSCAPNIVPFESFAYGVIEMEVRVVTNANKFQAGKVIVSVVPDPVGLDNIAQGYQAMLTRPHIMLDLPSRDEGVLKIPFKYHNAQVRLAATSLSTSALESGIMARLIVMVLSPLAVATGSPVDCTGQVFYRFTKADFTGMTYRVSFATPSAQMDGEVIDTMVKKIVPFKTLRAITAGVEGALNQLGSSHNQDKPPVVLGSVVVPRPRLMFPNTKGLGEATRLTMDPVAMTSHHIIHEMIDEPKSFKQLARIWGLRMSGTWQQSDAFGKRIIDELIDPTNRNSVTAGALTPLEYAMGLFTFWNGTLEYRFDFVSTAFHQGAVMISVEYNRPKVDSTEEVCSTASTYTKTFHLGEQRSVTMEVPYISDTVYQRTRGCFCRVAPMANGRITSNPDKHLRAMWWLAPDVKTRIRVTVINQLRPVSSVVSSIEVLVYVRAGKNFTMKALKQPDFIDFSMTNAGDYMVEVPPATGKPPTRTIHAQMDTGEKEDEDETAVLSSGLDACHIQNADASTDFKDILRRPTLVINRQPVRLAGVFTAGSATADSTWTVGWFLPVVPPNRSMVDLENDAQENHTLYTKAGLQASPTLPVTSLFRHCRGSHRYTIIVEAVSGSPLPAVVYVTYIPHSGATKMGNQAVSFPQSAESNKQIYTATNPYTLPYMGGYATEIIIPSVNPTATVEVPFETENSWQNIGFGVGSVNRLWRDATTTNNGHIVVTVLDQPCLVTIWWAAGDDFALSSFLGIPWVLNDAFGWRMTDTDATTANSAAQNAADLPTFVQVTAVSTNTATTTTITASNTTPATPTNQVDPGVRVVMSSRQVTPLRVPREEPTTSLNLPEFTNWLRAPPAAFDRETVMAKRKAKKKKRKPRAMSQMDPGEQDFPDADASTSVGSVLYKVAKGLTPKLVRNTLVANIPVIGVPSAMALVGSDMASSVDKVCHRAKESMDNVDEKISLLSEKVGTTTDHLIAMLQRSIDTTFLGLQSVISKTTLVFDLMLDLIIAWWDRSWTAVGVGIVRLLVKLIPTTTVTILAYGQQLGSAISGWINSQTQVQLQADTHTVTVVGVLAGVVGTLLGVYVDAERYTSLFMGIVQRLTSSSGIVYFNHVLQFVKATFHVIQDMVMDAFGMISPETAALQKLAGSSEELQNFIKSAQTITSESNRQLINVPGYRVKIWRTVMQAWQLQRIMAEVPNNCVSPVVSRLCSKVIQYGNENFCDMASSPVRYEPFVICLTGESGIGKSHMVQHLSVELLKAVGYSSPVPEVVFVRQPGSQFWSGWRNHPVVVIDEWMQMNDAQIQMQQLNELYQLKTPASFTPNMAHLEEKRMKANPLIVFLCCNNAFPSLDLVNDKKSTLRRRDEVIQVEVTEEYANMPVRDLPSEVRNNYGHLRFRGFDDPSDRTTMDKDDMNFQEFKDYIVEAFKLYHQVELENVKGRCEKLFKLNTTVPLSQLDIRDPFSVYYTAQMTMVDLIPEQDLWVLSERLEQDLNQLVTLIETVPTVQIPENVVAAQMGWWQVVHYVGSTMALWGYGALALKWFWEQTEDLVSETILTEMSELPRPRARCDVCLLENRPVTVLCRAEYEYYRQHERIRHAACERCCERLSTCPVCRSDDLVQILSQDEVTLMIRLLKYLRVACHSVQDIFETLSGMAFVMANYQRFSDMFEWVGCAILVCSGTIRPAIGLACLVGRTLIHVVDRTIRGGDAMGIGVFNSSVQPGFVEANVARLLRGERPIHQMDHDEEEFHETSDGSGASARIERLRTRERRRPNLVAASGEYEVHITREMVEQRYSREIVTRLDICGHVHMISGVMPRYKDGNWTVQIENVMVQIPDGVCGAQCHWAGPDGVEHQFQAYEFILARREPDIRSLIVRYGTLTADDPMKGILLSKIPRIFQPEWMLRPLVLEAEIQEVLEATTWWESLTDITVEWRQLLTVLASVVGVCATMIAGYEAYQYLFHQNPIAAGAQASAYDANRTAHVNTVRVQRAPSGGYFPREQSESHSQMDEVVSNYILQNTALVQIVAGDGTVIRKLYGLGVREHFVIIPRHYHEFLSHTEHRVKLSRMVTPYKFSEYTYSASDFVISNANDIAVWKWPPSTELYKNITSFFVRDEDLEKPLPSQGRLHAVPVRGSVHMLIHEVGLSRHLSEMVVNSEDQSQYTVYDVLAYNFSKAGACGSILTVGHTQRPIVAMHVAGIGEGLSGEGYGIILTQENLQVLVEMKVPEIPELQIGPLEEAKIVFEETVQVTYHGSLPPEMTPHTPHKSKLERSSVYGEEGLVVDIAPAILSGQDPRYTHAKSPLVLGASKHGIMTKDFSTDQLRGPIMFVKDLLATLKPLVMQPKRLTIEEAIGGLRQEYYDPMDLNTSVGFPFNVKYPLMPRKSDFANVVYKDGEVVQVEVDPLLKDELQAASQMRKEGRRYPTLFQDVPKDEKRATEKLMSPGGTRIFCNGPYEHAVAMRQHFLHFSAAFMKQRRHMYHAVGINPTGMEWNLLAMALLNKDTRVVTLDYSNFGPGLNARVAQAAVDLIREWTRNNVQGVDDLEMQCLLAECVNSYHVCSNTVYSQTSGSPSGAVLTSVINSLVNILYILVAWQEIMGPRLLKEGIGIFEEFRSKVCLVVYGDDLIMTVKDHVEIFNASTITTFFANYSIVATDASKSQKIVKYQDIREATFLKRSFVRHPSRPNMWMSKVAETSILSSTQWVWRSPNREEATRVNCEMALRNAHGLGPQEYDVLRKKINTALVRHNIDPVSLTWQELDIMIYDYGFALFKWS